MLRRLDIPPFYLLLSLILMLVFHYTFPLAVVFSGNGHKIVGIVFLFLGFGMTTWGIRTFRYYQTPVKIFERPNLLIKTGLFKYTRNPIYLGMVLVCVGAAIYLGSVSSFFIAFLFFFLLQKRFVLREEKYLEEVFGEEYREYKKKVRRWI